MLIAPRLHRPGPSSRPPRQTALSPGPYALQAAIAACHAHAHSYEDTDWPRIATLYAALAARSPSPVVEFNRAVAVSMAEGPAPALRIIDALTTDPALKATTCSPASEATCSYAWAAQRKQKSNS